MFAVTFDDVCQTMAAKSGAKTPEEWSDFFAMPVELQEVEAKLFRDAVWAKEGPSAWTSILTDLGIAVTVLGDVSGIGSALVALRSV